MSFFPDPLFGWVFYLVLVGITAVAAYIDLRRMTIPKWLSLPTLVLGFLFNLVRGAWMGWLEKSAWLLEPNDWLVGALDGLLFALAGFGVALGLFLAMWLLGTCGGGDVKLCAALGAWIGPYWTLYLLVVTMLCLIFFGIARLIWSLLTVGMSATKKSFYASQGKRASQQTGRRSLLVPRKRLVTFSLPVFVATTLVLMWAYRKDLLPSPPPAPPGNGAQANAHP